MNDQPCNVCGSTRRGQVRKGRRLGTCLDCRRRINARPKNVAARRAYSKTAEGKASQARADAKHAATAQGRRTRARAGAVQATERAAYRNLLLMSMGVTDLSQAWEFHHVIGRKATGHQIIAMLLGHKNTWAQAWTEAHTLCVVMTNADHNRYHSEHKMQEDGTFVVR